MKKSVLPLCLAASLLLPLAQCSDHGIEVAVSLLHHYRKGPDGTYPAGQPGGAPRTFQTSLGYQVTLTRAYLAIGSVEIVACPGASAWLRRAVFGSGRALAHTPASPTRIGTPHVESLLRADFEPLALGDLAPPPGAYCTALVAVAQADADAEGLPADVSMVGKSIYLEGRYVPPMGGAPTDFTIVSLVRQSATVTLMSEQGQPSPLRLDGASAGAQLNIGISYDGWLDGVDFAAMSADAQAQKVADNALGSIHHHPAAVAGGDHH
jgi:hypothetical protein